MAGSVVTKATESQHGGAPAPLERAPFIVRLFDPLTQRLLRAGMPLGPNILLTVRGRRSGEPRTVGVALTTIDDRRWVVGGYGEVNWVRNLRAAGEGSIRVNGRDEQVRARAYTPAEALAFYRDILGPWVRRSSLPRRIVSRIILGDVLGDPVAAARDHPVFELYPVTPTA